MSGNVAGEKIRVVVNGDTSATATAQAARAAIGEDDAPALKRARGQPETATGATPAGPETRCAICSEAPVDRESPSDIDLQSATTRATEIKPNSLATTSQIHGLGE